jgi:uncharacterized membrane protein
MPYCTQCGNEVGNADLFCGRCGSAQGDGEAKGAAPGAGASAFAGGGAAAAAVKADPLSGLNSRNASILCYVPFVGWIASIVVLAAEKFREDREVRFHAFQGLYLFVFWLFVDWVFGPLTRFSEATRFMGGALKVGVVGVWIFMLVKTSQGQFFRLPILGELAERSVSEQK